jgi:hypothetical protein
MLIIGAVSISPTESWGPIDGTADGWSTACDERPAPLPPGCYTFGADGTGYPRRGDPPLSVPGLGGHPGARSAGGTCTWLKGWESD